MKPLKVLIITKTHPNHKLYLNHGLPKSLADIVTETTFPENRCGSIITHLESVPDIGEDFTVDEEFIDNMNVGQIIRTGNKYFVVGAYSHLLLELEIITVDTSRPWTINNLWDHECIEYLEFKRISKALNYWEK